MIEVVIDSIRVSLISQQRIVMLRDVDGEHQLPIWIGPCEAESITIELQETEMARPMTHDLLKIVVENMGGTISHILINELREQVFHAELHLKVDGDERNIDCRPSDAIALAIRAKVPIYVTEDVMDEAGITPEPDITGLEDAVDGDESDSAETPPTEGEGPTQEELDAFRDFLENLDDE